MSMLLPSLYLILAVLVSALLSLFWKVARSSFVVDLKWRVALYSCIVTTFTVFLWTLKVSLEVVEKGGG